MNGGLYFSHPACLAHDPRVHSPGHPDTPERLLALERELSASWPARWERREGEPATDAELELVHTPAHVRFVQELCAAGGGPIDLDTFVGEKSYDAALAAAGAACTMTRALLAGDAGLGFCAVRPSGHHAEPGRAMGFCLFNNVAVAAQLAIATLGVSRVFILDWDVHHGNGTAEAFRARSDVLFASIHQSPLYPGTGPLGDVGSGAGEGFTINLPVAPGSEEPVWLSLLAHVALAAAAAFEPQLVLVSAGFDAHAQDPLANCRLSTESFAKMARLVRDMAARAGAPLGVVLEGGYNQRVLGECVRATLEALTGSQRAEPVALEPALTSPAAAALGRWWPLTQP
ncbi:MAG TPA: histone deacetylase [Solirubrobacteraceae bacterium]|nr:histone deacetylase [Solirubrobacteraceae bacterium]